MIDKCMKGALLHDYFKSFFVNVFVDKSMEIQ